MKVDAIRALTTADLNAQVLALKEEQMRLRFQLATNQVTSHATIRTAKKDIARIYTVLREREMAEAYERTLG